jgi:hypothetical protein
LALRTQNCEDVLLRIRARLQPRRQAVSSIRGYKGWTKNGYKDGQWHGIPYSSPTQQPSAKRGSASTSYASGSEMELIQQQVARRREQEAQQHSQSSAAATPANPAKQP